MEICNKDKSNDYTQELSCTDKFNKLFFELDRCSENEQKLIIEEMNELLFEMDFSNLRYIFITELFDKMNKMNKMIEEKKLSMENAILLLKHVGYCKVMKNIWIMYTKESLLKRRIDKMIADENEKKEEKNENLLVGLCECYVALSYDFPSELLSIFVPCLLKASSSREENKEAQKEVEMALLTLNYIDYFMFIERKLYLNEIKEIIEHHQEHHNLTRLAYQSAWQFLMNRLPNNSLEEVIVNELHFARDTRRELERLVKQVDLKRREGKTNGKEMKEMATLMRWLGSLNSFFRKCKLWNEEFVGIIRYVVQIFRVSKDNYKEISGICISPLISAADNGAVKVDYLLKGGAIDALLEEIQQPTLNDKIAFYGLQFLMRVSRPLKEKKKEEMEEEERKATKRKVFEKLEEEGYEDAIICFHKIFDFLNLKFRYDFKLSLNISDYFVYI
ncbi:uncharacterized protein MONOS_18210 [Monocercomonoides exilis]|uniref:uncharacterized protein n=1 Tax=Monocercomonoides exilis TaxID=2049356 RepID=UPI003559B448|nr:hypothetical protein MONOS_18210 [Monocercomonoides exilis]